MLVLTGDGRLQDRLAHPKYGKHKIYWIQVDRIIDPETCQRLEQGIQLSDGPAHAIRCHRIDPPPLPDREPPVRVRKKYPDELDRNDPNEGRNRQVHRMTAALGFPTLRLVRVTMGDYQLCDLSPGEYRVIDVTRVKSVHAKQRYPSHRRHVRRR